MSGMLKRQKARDSVIQEAVRDTYKQFMIDMLCLTLNDPEIMDKDVFGYNRLMTVCEGVLKKCEVYEPSLTKHPDADYLRSKMDESLVRIARDPKKITPFEIRYPWVAKITYGKK